MADETTDFILGDAAADALGQGRRGRGFLGRRKKPKTNRPPLTHCENCQAALTGEYCANCGQHAIDYRRSLLRVLIDAADSFLNWDTKFLKSVGVLLAKPWKLTNDFNAGRRARYVHPLRLYLLASIAFFLLAKLINLTPSDTIDLSAEDRAEFDTNLDKLAAPDSPLTPEQRAKVEAARALFDDKLSGLSTEDRATVDKTVMKLQGFAHKKNWKPKDALKLEGILDQVPHPSPFGPPLPPQAGEASIPPITSVPKPSPTPKANSVIQFDNTESSKDPFGAWIEQRVKDKVGEDGTKAKLFLDTLRSNIPTMMLCCIPLFAFVLKVLYIRQRRYYVEHLVYALHIHTFAYLTVVLITLFGMAIAHWSELARILVVVFLSCVVFVQVFVSIRRVYNQGWFFTTFKFMLGGLAYFFILVIAVGATAFITLLLPT